MKDAAWIARPGPHEELRMSMRSAHAHVGVENVWIVGAPPPWNTGPRLPGNRYRTKQRNVWDNVRILAEHSDLPEQVAVWNDDFFAMQPVKVEMAWRCTLAEHIETLKPTWWRESLTLTQQWLTQQGIAEPLSYELHRPFPIHRATMADILADAAHLSPLNPPQWRTLYGNLAHAGGTQDGDGKVYGAHTPTPSGAWMSSTDRSFGSVRHRLRQAFPRRSPWERGR